MMFMKIVFFFVFIFVVEIKAQAEGLSGMDIEYATTFDQELYKRVIDEDKCNEQLEFLSNNSDVALLFQDASGKIPTGFLAGNLVDLGDYHECLAIKHLARDMEIEGKYCMMQYPLKQIQENNTDTTTDPPNIDLSNITDIFPQLNNSTLQDINQYRNYFY